MSTEKKNVLVVEDDQAVRAAVASILERKGYRVTSARDAETAVGMLPGADVMLLDVFLPGMTGDQLLRKIRAEGNYIPVVVMSAALREEDVDESLKDLKVVSFVPKPFRTPDLLSKLERACELASDMASVKTATAYLKGFIKRQAAAY